MPENISSLSGIYSRETGILRILIYKEIIFYFNYTFDDAKMFNANN